MEYVKLIQDTLYWIQQEKKTFLYSQNLLFSPQKPLSSFRSTAKQPLAVEGSLTKENLLEKKEKDKILSIPEKKILKEQRVFTKDLSLSFSKIRTFYKTYYPSMKLLENPLEDGFSKKIAKAYIYKNQASEITLLAYCVKEKDLLFLKALAKAISLYFFPCKVLENTKEMDWLSFLTTPHLKGIIATEYALWEKGSPQSFVKEIPSQSEWFLHNTPLFFLDKLSSYYKNPYKKKTLWNELCQKLSNL